MLIARKDKATIEELKEKLHEFVFMKDFGEARHILGMRIECDRSQKILRLSQTEYVQKALWIFNVEN